MKKSIFLLLIFILSFFVFSVSQTTKPAKAQTEVKSEIEKEIDENLNDLIPDDLNQYFNTIEENFGFSFKEFVRGIIDGKIQISAESILQIFLDGIKRGIKETFLSLIGVLVLCILSAISKNITAGLKKEGIDNLIYFSIYGAIICTLIVIISDLVRSVTSTIQSINSIMDYIFPILVTLLTAIGGTSGVSFLQPITIVISNVVIKMILNVIIPIFYASLVFTFVGNLSDAIKLERFHKTLKSIANWILGIVFSIITTFVTIQGLVGASIDTITIKSAKFALSTYVPILGGYLAEGFDIVMASCVLIKNALGLTAFVILLAVLMTPIVKVLLVSLSLKIISSFVEPLGETKVASLLFDTASNLKILIASIAGVSFLVFILLSLVIGAFNGGVV